jgi:hypothetical protein
MVQTLNSSSTSPESALRPVGGARGWAAREDLIGPSATRRLVRMALPNLPPLHGGRPFRTHRFRQCKTVAPLVNPALTELLRLVGHRRGGLLTSNDAKCTGRPA